GGGSRGRRRAARRRAPPTVPTRYETPVSPARRARPLLRLSYGGRQLLADDLVHQLAVRPALELGHHLSHDLSEILRPTGNGLPHGAPALVGVHRGGQELVERLPLGELRLPPSLASLARLLGMTLRVQVGQDPRLLTLWVTVTDTKT